MGHRLVVKVRISIADLEQALDFIKRRSTDVALSLIMDNDHIELRFGDVDQQIIVVYLYTHESNRMARVTSTEKLLTLISALRKPTGASK